MAAAKDFFNLQTVLHLKYKCTCIYRHTTHMHICMLAYTYISAYIWNVPPHIYMCIPICMLACTRMHVSICMYTHTTLQTLRA